MSDIEETLERIKAQNGVESYVICQPCGTVLRRHNLEPEEAQKYAEKLLNLVQNAQHYVRDVDPTDGLRIIRIRANEREFLVATEKEFVIICVQRWTPAATT